MAKIVLSLAAVLMLASAYFSFASKTKVGDLQNTLKSTSEQLHTTESTLTKTKSDLKASQEQTAAITQKADASAAEVTRTKEDLDKATAQVKDTEAKLDAANKRLAEIGNVPGKEGGQGPGAGPTQAEFDALQNELKTTRNDLAKATDEASTQKSRATDAEGRAKVLEQAEQKRKAGLLRPGVEAQVIAVNPGWNFVVLNLGDRQGAVANAEMIVTRNGERIGKVRISSVEPATSVADIVPNSLARGVRIQPGDRVIYVPAGGG